MKHDIAQQKMEKCERASFLPHMACEFPMLCKQFPMLSRLHSWIYSAGVFDKSKLLFDLRHISRQGVDISVFKEGDWWGLGLLLTFLQTPCITPGKFYGGFVPSLAKTGLAKHPCFLRLGKHNPVLNRNMCELKTQNKYLELYFSLLFTLSYH